VELLERVARELPLEVWGYGADRLDTDSALRLAYRGEAWGVDMYRTLAQSRIVINRHGPIAEGYANNMRLFEATGMGATLVTEAAPNLRDLFSSDNEVATYNHASDLLETIRSLLVDDGCLLRLAGKGQQRVLADHTYSRRIEQLVSMLEERLTRRVA
jgi:spore maturation protein CgeB